MGLRTTVVFRRQLTPQILAVLALSASCASIQNTPQQDYVWEMGRRCDTTTLWMDRVEAGGRYWIRGASNVITGTPYFECMKEQIAKTPYREWLSKRSASLQAATTPPSATGSLTPSPGRH